MQTIGVHSQAFVDGLNVKLGDYGTFGVIPGKVRDKITVTPNGTNQTSVYAFVDFEGNVYKPAGWNAPAKGIRYYTIASALVAADRFGSFLYARR
jgi:hypothetical protein